MKKKILAVILSVLCLTMVLPMSAFAGQDDVSISGTENWNTLGGCLWQISDDGTLTIKPSDAPAAGYTKGQLPDDCKSKDSWPWDSQRTSINNVVFEQGVKAGDSLVCMFEGCNSLINIKFSDFDTSNAKNMSSMFFGCSSLTSLDLSKFNTENVTDMSYMFASCSSLTSLDLSNFDTSMATNMSFMFMACSSLTSLNLSKFNTKNVTNMSSMFSACSSLTSLDISGFNTANVTNMSRMFYSCSSLESLDLSEFNTANVTNMSSMFCSCSSLESLDISGFNTANVTDMSGMFNYCGDLEKIYAGSKWATGKVALSEIMFNNCQSLVGGAGTAYNLFGETTAAYARIDGDETPGYFTGKYTVTYDSNGGEGTMTPQTFIQGKTQALTQNAFTKTGYTFTAWTADTDNFYTDKQEITVNADMMLTALWTVSQEYKNAAKGEIDNKASSSNNTINAMKSLSDAEKGKYMKEIDVAAASARAAVDAATTVEKVDAAKATGIAAIAEIEKKARFAQVSVDEIKGQVYNGAEIKPAVTVKEETKVLTADVDYTVSYKNNINAGTATVTVTGKGNYAGTKDVTFTITKADQSAPTGLTATAPSVKGGSDGSISGTSDKMEYKAAAASEYTPVSGTEITGLSAGTYKVRYAADANHNAGTDADVTVPDGKITPVATDFTFTAPSNLVYNGTAKAATVTTAKEGMGTITVKYFDKDGKQLASAPVDAGTYTVKIDVAEGTAYKTGSDLTAASWTFTITQAPVTVTAKDASKVYGTDDPEFTATVEGTIGTDKVEYTVTRAAAKDVGTYAITPVGDASQGNYTVTYKTGTFTITQAPVTVTAKDASKEYGAKDPDLTAEVKGTLGTDTVKYTVSRTKGEDAGAYTITPAGDVSQGNYAVTYVSGTFTVNPAKDTPVKTDTDALAKIQKEYQEKNPGSEVKVEMQVSEKAAADDVKKIQEKAGTKKLVSFDASLVVKVDEKTVADAGSSNKTLVSTTYKFDFANKSEIQAFRVHEGSVDELTTNPNADGEYVKLDKTAGTITVVASKYSTYAFAYKESAVPATGDSGNAWFYIVIAVFALGAAAGAGIAMRKRAKR